MAMRYIIRRKTPDDFTDIRKQHPNLEKELGAAAENFRRYIKVSLSPLEQIQYTFLSSKRGTGWVWTCPTAELVAEDEKGLFKMTDSMGVPRPDHLKHL